jgi:hypothetical protein
MQPIDFQRLNVSAGIRDLPHPLKTWWRNRSAKSNRPGAAVVARSFILPMNLGRNIQHSTFKDQELNVF